MLRDRLATSLGVPGDNIVRASRPARASKATPAYRDLLAGSQAPDPNLAATSQAQIRRKATPACPDSAATSHAHDSRLALRRRLSYEPFEPLQDQARSDGINPFMSACCICPPV